MENRTRLNSPSLLQCVLHFLGVYYEAEQVTAKLHINFLWLYYKADKLRQYPQNFACTAVNTITARDLAIASTATTIQIPAIMFCHLSFTADKHQQGHIARLCLLGPPGSIYFSSHLYLHEISKFVLNKKMSQCKFLQF